MKLLRINAEKPEKGLVSIVAKEVAGGGVIIYPTDTVYGIGCRLDPVSIKRVFEVKRRDVSKPLSIACRDLDLAKEYAYISRAEEGYIRANLGRPMTFILKKRDVVPDIVTGGLDSVGVRIIDSPFVRELLSVVGEPIVTTSANVSGGKAPVRVSEISAEVKNGVDYVVDGGPCRVGVPSMVVYPSTGRVV